MQSPIRHAIPFLALSLLFACNDSGGGKTLPVNVINMGNACIQPSFPAEQPDLSIFVLPRFLLTTSAAQQSSSGQAQVRPGDPLEAEITVNSATRKVMIEVTDAWAPTHVIATDEVETAGNETIELVLFPTNTNRGRYYMKLTLCGFDCDEREVVFDIFECPPDPVPEEPCGINNAPYRRTVFEDGDLLQTDGTCIDLGGVPGVGSGTVLVQ
jgi:hypothetical protein